MKKILDFLKYNKGSNNLILFSFLLQGVVLAILYASSDVLKNFISAIQFRNEQLLNTTVIAGVIVTVLTIAASYADEVFRRHVYNKSEQNVQTNVISKLLALRKPAFQSYKTGEIITITTQNVPSALQMSVSAIFSTLNGIVSIIFGIFYMGSLNMKLMLAVLLFNIALNLVLPYFNKQIKLSQKKLVQLNNKSNNFLVDLLSNSIIARAFAKEDYFGKRFRENEESICRSSLKAFILSNGTSEIIWSTKKVAEVAILYGFGGWLVFHGEM